MEKNLIFYQKNFLCLWRKILLQRKRLSFHRKLIFIFGLVTIFTVNLLSFILNRKQRAFTGSRCFRLNWMFGIVRRFWALSRRLLLLFVSGILLGTISAKESETWQNMFEIDKNYKIEKWSQTVFNFVITNIKTFVCDSLETKTFRNLEKVRELPTTRKINRIA